MSSSDSDSISISARRRSGRNTGRQINLKESDDENESFDELPLSEAKSVKTESDDDEDDVPIGSKRAPVEKKNKRPTKRTKNNNETKKGTRKKAEPVKEEDEDDLPLNTKAKPRTARGKSKESKKVNGTPVKKEEMDDRDLTPLKSGPPSPSPKSSTITSRNRSPNDDDEEEEEEDFKWWEQGNIDGTQKWSTLEHSGVLFAPQYEPLPKDVKLYYDGKPVDLPLEAEEVAGFFGAMVETDHAKNPTFQKNFFRDFLAVCKECNFKHNIKEFSKCDFSQMFHYFERKRDEKRNMSKEQKKEIKKKKDEEEESYKWCTLDGRKERVGNFRIEPPGLFRGRGNHPKTGSLKRRVFPEQITINIGKEAPVPKPLPGHHWAEVRHDNTVTWLATWHENVNNNVKYVFLAAGSSLKGQSDLKKYEKSRKLKDYIDDIREGYTKDLKSDLTVERQRGTAMYLIDVFALRAGNEKGEDEADTVGCCSLRYEHVSLKPPNIVIFDFLGKDSIRYYNEVEVDPQVFKNLRIFKRSPKKEGDLIFDRLTTNTLNKYLTSLMDGLSAKVFRTYNASHTMNEELKKMPKSLSLADKVLFYNRANRTVAILCNHQRSVTKNHDVQMERYEERIKALQYQRLRLHRMMLSLEPKLSKKMPELVQGEAGIDDEWVKRHHELLYELEKEKIKKKFERDNEKIMAEDPKGKLPDNELEKRLTAADQLKAVLDAEYRTTKVHPGRATLERLESRLSKLNDRIKVMRTQMIDKDENKTTALTTSKINYIDPRLTFSFSRREEVPIEKLFSKTIRDKFNWASETPADWEW
ncbi:DNA topoisomerase I [Schizosaccharomyces osmophilus]|uniref:DNA topoisomerase I n=1 Tax=Schizosaccharomyces osmophilus TaxID=2545709 RepID=A0AAE9WBI4_9SCHI|nr:DNA topoisomerase I [Schizosaccharomyces osmophilus]WBW72411.1 DNA topoisomerase I [Schizosaccharomyces osmophilus]